MCGSKPKMPAAAPPAPPPIPDATPGAVAPILGNQQAQLRRFDALRELSKLVIPSGQVKHILPPAPTDPRAGHNSRSTQAERARAEDPLNPTRGGGDRAIGTSIRPSSSPPTRPGFGTTRR